MRHVHPLAFLGLALGAFVWAAPAMHAAADAEAAWEPVDESDGITSWKRSLPEGPLPELRSEVVLEARLQDTWAALADVAHGCEWMTRCARMQRLSGDDDDMIVYTRMDAPWPVRDRDVVTHVRTERVAATEWVVRVESTAWDSPLPSEGVVRMRKLEASYRMWQLEGGRLRVRYEVVIDPAGSLPNWLKRFAATRFAHDVLDALRRRVEGEPAD